MKIKHIDGLSESLDRRTQLINSGSLGEVTQGATIIVYDSLVGNQAYISASRFVINDDQGPDGNIMWSSDKINSQIINATFGLQSTILPPVADTASLKSTYSSSLQLTDKAFILVEDQGLYRFDSQSEATDDGYRVIQDTDFNGRWIKISLSSDLYLRKPTSGTDGNLIMIGGTSRDTATDSTIAASNVLQKGSSDAASGYLAVYNATTPSNYVSASDISYNVVTKRVYAHDNATDGYIAVFGKSSNDSWLSSSQFNVSEVLKKGTTNASSGYIGVFGEAGSKFVSASTLTLSNIPQKGTDNATSGRVAIYTGSNGYISSSTLDVGNVIYKGSSTAATGYIAVFNGVADKMLSSSAITLANITRYATVAQDEGYVVLRGSANSQYITSSNVLLSKLLVTGSSAAEDNSSYVAVFNSSTPSRYVSASNLSYEAVVKRAFDKDNATDGYIAVFGKGGSPDIGNRDQWLSSSAYNVSTMLRKGSNTGTSGYLAIFNYQSDKIVSASTTPISSLVTAGSIPLYTINIVTSSVVASGGARTIDVYRGSQLPYPVDNSKMLLVSVEGIVYASASSKASIQHEEYYVSSSSATELKIFLSSSYTIEADETICVSYLSYTSSFNY